MCNSIGCQRPTGNVNTFHVFSVVLSLLLWNVICISGELTRWGPHKVHVRVYYESLCPDSRAFITHQLEPVLSLSNGALASRVHLDLVPFGKSKWTYNSSHYDYTFQCHHGPDECIGNTLHACALNVLKRDGAPPNVILDFIACLMATVDQTTSPIHFPVSTCGPQSGISNTTTVESCAKRNEGKKYLADYGRMTDLLRPPLSTVPTIVFGDAPLVDAAQSNAAQRDFLSALCSQLGDDAPSDCDEHRDSKAILATKHTFLFIACVLLALLRLF